MKQEIPQSLESQLKMARPRRHEVKRVPLSEKEKEFLGEIMDKAVAAEKAGELAEALVYYTDYRNELMKIKDEKEGAEKKEKAWQQFFLQYEDLLSKIFKFHFLKEKFEQAKNMEKDVTAITLLWEPSIKNVQNELESLIDSINEIKVLGTAFWSKLGFNVKNALKGFDISDEELEKYNTKPPHTIVESDVLDKKWQIKPEIKEEIEQILRKDEKIQERVEKLYKRQVDSV